MNITLYYFMDRPFMPFFMLIKSNYMMYFVFDEINFRKYLRKGGSLEQVMWKVTYGIKVILNRR